MAGSKTTKKVSQRAPSARQIKAAKLTSENIRNPKPKSKGEILLEAGYSKQVSKKPKLVTETPTFQQLLEDFLPDNKLANVHRRLLDTRKIEHMVFPLGPEGEDDENLSGSQPNKPNELTKAGVPPERTTLSDVEIKEMLAEVNCKVKRIVHGNTARHVYFWAHDAAAQTKALELAYKMKGLTPTDDGKGATFNFFNQGDSSQSFIKQ